MGHTRINLLHSRKWRQVVELIAGGADVEQVANATLNSAEDAFQYVKINEDVGFNQAAWIMVQLGIAAKSDDPVRHLQNQGIHIPQQTSLPGIISAISDAMDTHLDQHGKRSDLSEIAQRALIGAVTDRMRPKLENRLFAVSSDDVKDVLGEFHKQKEFSKLSRHFFEKLTNECMDYFLSQTLSSQVGEGQRFASMNEKAQFDDALSTHCLEASKVIEDYSGGWFSKHIYEEEGDISRESVKGFASYGMKKMTEVLKAGAQQNAG
ncbi:MAG: hypothetical protein H8E17_08690 [Deltaproteobacteria bacterium]|nr:hypothetical protein [Deltaproteobacteria bacterium]